jgi:UDP-3-O-acyl-N-acetylglucosamine deacetylase
MEEWNEWSEKQETPNGDISVREIETLCAQIREQREKVKEAADVKAKEQAALDALEQRFIEVLEQHGKTSYDAADARFGISYRSSVRVPQGDQRAEFFEYLKKTGEFDSLITVNSQTLQGWLKQKIEAAKESGTLMDFKVPGLDEPTLTPVLSVRKK